MASAPEEPRAVAHGGDPLQEMPEAMTESAAHTTDHTDRHVTSPVPAPRRGRALGFVAGAAFMCVLSAGVGAGAATLVTSAQIKDGTIVGKDVKNGGLTGVDIKDGSLGGRDLKNGSVTGADVKDGSIGSADIADGTIAGGDLSAAARADLLQGLIPSGTTVTGVGFLDVQAAASGDFGFTVTLPGRAHAALTNENVNFRTDDTGIYADEDDINTCAGSSNVPTAPPGQVCIYMQSGTSDSTNIRGAEVYNKPNDQTFAVRWFDNNTANADVFITVVWAYTAP
jgi:hypothetical protein